MFNINLGDTVHFSDRNDYFLIMQGIVVVISIDNNTGNKYFGIELFSSSPKSLYNLSRIDQNELNSWIQHPDFTVSYMPNLVGKSLYLWIEEKDITYMISPPMYVGAGFTTQTLQGITIGASKPIDSINIVIDLKLPSEEPITDDDDNAGLKYL